MITKFEKYNESISSLLVGPTKDEVWEQLGFPHSFNTPEEFVKYLMEHVTKKQTPIFGDTIVARYNGKLIYENEFNKYKLWVSDFVLSVIMNIFGYSSYDAFTVIEKYFRSNPLFKTHGVYELSKYYRREEDIVHESVKSLLVGPTEEEVLNNLKDLTPNELLLKSSKKGILIGVKFALEKGADININNGRPLCDSCYLGYDHIVKYLIENGADIHIRNEEPLKESMYGNNYDITKYLLENGANPRINNWEPYKIALKKDKRFEFLLYSYIYGTNESIKSLLVGPTKEEIWKNLGFPTTIDTSEDLIDYILYKSVVDNFTIKSSSNYYVIDHKVYLDINTIGKCCTINKVNLSPLLNIFGIKTEGDKKRFVKKHLKKRGVIDDVYTMYIENDLQTL